MSPQGTSMATGRAVVAPYCVGALDSPLMSAARFTRRGDAPGAPVVAIPQGAAYSIVCQLEDFASHKLWCDGRLVHTGGHARHVMALTDLRRRYACQHLSGFDNVRLRFGCDAFEQLADEMFGGKASDLRLVQGAADATVHGLVQALLPYLARHEQGDELFIEHVALAMAAHIMRRYGRREAELERSRPAGPCVERQMARAKEYMIAYMARDFTLADVAAHCGMSRSVFARAFKSHTRSTPFEWIRAQRVEHAKHLLARSDALLVDISTECGFSDQSHFSRVFTQLVGVGPRAWRAQGGK
ncbi:helix-turn-helix transcriptional regulator [Bordetella genomosp. 6]|uniref:helix-turn-helix transcriptional regulator n=1 Tax=Bordetella genomosp. 6 TaxID=463024 RepID=UPI0012FB4077|nr:AraC family transcriptional regulator [Bordetella genomosp. 6]